MGRNEAQEFVLQSCQSHLLSVSPADSMRRHFTASATWGEEGSIKSGRRTTNDESILRNKKFQESHLELGHVSFCDKLLTSELDPSRSGTPLVGSSQIERSAPRSSFFDGQDSPIGTFGRTRMAMLCPSMEILRSMARPCGFPLGDQGRATVLAQVRLWSVFKICPRQLLTVCSERGEFRQPTALRHAAHLTKQAVEASLTLASHLDLEIP